MMNFRASHERRFGPAPRFLFVLSLALAGHGRALAEPAAVTSNDAATRLNMAWSLDFVSRYCFQGFDYSDGQPVLQPTLSLGYGGASGTLWFNHDLDLRRSDEFDWSIQYEESVGRLSVAGGYMYVRYPHRDGWAPSQEFYSDLSAELPLSPSLSIHRDFDAGKGWYLTAGASHPLIAAPLPLTLDSRLFYERHYYSMSGIPSAELRLGTEVRLGRMTVSPGVSRFQTWENGDFRGAAALDPAWVFSLSLGGEY